MVNQKKATRNIELSLVYVGTHFSGWQVQPHRVTVQGVLQKTLRRILKQPDLKITGASRTDSGVHAHDQHANFRTSNTIPLSGLIRALNHQLPGGIRIRKAVERPLGFSARYGASAKQYAYYIFNRATASPFMAPFVWEQGRPLNAELMNQAAGLFVGTRCFGALQASGDGRNHSKTSIYHARVGQAGSLLCFETIGHSFLYHMVRNMAGSLVKVGMGEWTVNEMAARLDSNRREQLWLTAPAQGLHLVKVYYDEPPIWSPHSTTFMDFLNRADFW